MGGLRMKKVLVLLMSLFLVLTLAACGETETEEKDIGSVETSGQSDDEGADVEDDEDEETGEEDPDSEEKEFNEVILDDENATVTLTGIVTERDEIFGDEHKIKMVIENKSNATIEVQSREVSIDGFMVDDMVFFSETVAAGKKSNATMDIMTFDEDLPELNENIEFTLKIIDHDTFDDISTAEVSIDIN